MSNVQDKAAKVIGPRGLPLDDTRRKRRSINVVNITTSTQVIDIIGPADGTGTPALPNAASHILKLNPEVDAYYYWSDDSGALLDETVTGDTNPERQPDRLWAGQPVHEYPQGRYLVIKGLAAGKLRVSISDDL